MSQDGIRHLVDLEWDFFQATRNEGGRADCQDDRETFYVMRTGQAMGWSEEMVAAWTADLERAKAEGRNPVMEKYARMMASTAPEAYAAMEHLLPELDPEVERLARRLTDQTVAWAEAARERFPYVCGSGRPIRSAEDGPYVTSLETYCYGELLTASRETLACFQRYYAAKAERGENLYIEIQTHTARLLGYGGLEEAERVLCANTRSCCHHDPMTNG